MTKEAFINYKLDWWNNA